jgi:predicted O-linked N-acetylglucosamine transferase (SPINDLY family)
MGWLGYPGDSGLGTMDYVIGDPYVLPMSMQPVTRAPIVHLSCFACFTPPIEAPPVAPLPAATQGFIHFGCFHNPAKCSTEAIGVWAEILARLPHSRLVLTYKGFASPAVQQHFRDTFAARGIDGARIAFTGELPLPDLFAALNRIDIALDPFPFSGGLMTCFALWMGAPVITLPGETFASRQGLSFLSAIGLQELAAADAQDYVDKAVALAKDRQRLADLRQNLRPLMRQSPLCDGKKAAMNVQEIFRTIWRSACAKANSGIAMAELPIERKNDERGL